MPKDKDIRRSFLRYAIVATALIVLFLFLKKDSIITWIQAGVTKRRQEARIEWYRQDNERLDAQINMMSHDRDTLEKFAREQFNFAESGDDVYIIE